MTAQIQEALYRASTSIATVFGSVENLQAVDKIVMWGLRFFEALSKTVLPMGLSKLTDIVSVTESFINGVMLWTFGRSFFHAKTEDEVPQKLGKIGDQVFKAIQDKRDEKVGSSSFLYQLKHKTHLAVAHIGFALSYITCSVALLESFSVPVLATISKGLGMIPTIGQSLASGFSSHFFTFGGYALIAAHSSMVFDSIRYLCLCASDSSKSLTKGIIQLSSRVASLVLDILLVSNVSNMVVLGLAGLTAGILGVVSAIYNHNRKLQKEEQQSDLLKLAAQQNPIKV